MDEQHDSSRQAQDIAAQKAPTSSTSPRSAPRRASSLSLVGRRLGDYYLSESLRVGGMAEVYRAQDLVLMREVAVKVVSEAQLDDPSYVERFRTEARRAAALSHPHLVQVYQAGEEEVDGQRLLYLVMPLLYGSLHDLLKREGKLPYAEAAWLVLQVADGLEAAHAAGLIHRDVKPENILLDADGQALLADFGIARDIRYSASGSVAPTHTGLVAGTPQYMAPEQLRGAAIDRRVDVHALGVVLYEMLTGRLPFAGETSYEVAAHALRDPIPPPSHFEPSIPPAVEHVVLTALARDPDERYPTAAAFALALRRALLQPDTLDQRGLPTIPLAVAGATPMADDMLAAHMSGSRARQRANRRRWWLLAIAAVILIASAGAALGALQHRGQIGPVIVGGLPGASSAVASSQATGSDGQPLATLAPTVPGQPPLATPPAGGPSPGPGTAVPTATLTETSTATASPAPSSPLAIAPEPLVLSPAGAKMCTATQTVTNNSGQTVGWAWQPPSVGGMHFQIDGRPKVSWPAMTTNTPPGGQDTLVAMGDCQHNHGTHTIAAKDTLGNQYSFTMTLS